MQATGERNERRCPGVQQVFIMKANDGQAAASVVGVLQQVRYQQDLGTYYSQRKTFLLAITLLREDLLSVQSP